MAYLGFMAEELKRFSVEVLAWCLMTNHTHLIVVASDARFVGAGDRRSAPALHTDEKFFRWGARLPLSGSIRFVCIGRASFVGGIVMR